MKSRKQHQNVSIQITNVHTIVIFNGMYNIFNIQCLQLSFFIVTKIIASTKGFTFHLSGNHGGTYGKTPYNLGNHVP